MAVLFVIAGLPLISVDDDLSGFALLHDSSRYGRACDISCDFEGLAADSQNVIKSNF